MKQIRGVSFQCWEVWGAAARKVPPNKKERLFCKRPHHLMVKKDKGLCAPSRPVVLSATHRCFVLRNEVWGAAVRNVPPNKKERLFCKRPHHLMVKKDKGLCAPS